jgi:hypothetical protein
MLHWSRYAERLPPEHPRSASPHFISELSSSLLHPPLCPLVTSRFSSFRLEVYPVSLTPRGCSWELSLACIVRFNGTIDTTDVTSTEKLWGSYSLQLQVKASSWEIVMPALAVYSIAFRHGIREVCWRRVMQGDLIWYGHLLLGNYGTRENLRWHKIIQPPLIEQTVGGHFASIVQKFGDRTAWVNP